MPFKIIRNDITQMDTDAIVNAANTALAPGGGVCGAIFAAAGYDKLSRACAKIGGCKTGGAVITKGYNLKAKYIIHTAGPVYTDGNEHEAGLLYSCYKSSLILAQKFKVKSIAFPLISSGIYGYPKSEALKIATNAIADFLSENDMEVYLVVYDKKAFEISSKLFSDVQAYIDENIVREEPQRKRFLHEPISFGAGFPMPHAAAPEILESERAIPSPDMYSKKPEELDDMLKSMDKSFSETLLDLIDESGMKDSEVYKKANIDRRLFSKIRSDSHYKPSKITAVAFALALELDMRQTRDLMERAGYSMTHSSKFDIIIEYFIKRGVYNVFEINEVLFAFDQSLIGA